MTVNNTTTKGKDMTNATQLKAFEVGKTYYTASICDSNCIIAITVASRTKCFITTTEGQRLKVSDKYTPGEEHCSPWGSYSMSPTIGACDTKELNPSWMV